MKRVEWAEEGPSEALILELLQQQTSILTPAFRRNIMTRRPETFFGEPYIDKLCLIAMQYVPGRPLRVVWPTLSLWGKLRVIWTLRQYIRQLRRVSSPYSNRTGPLGGSDPLRPPGQIFFDKAPPCATSDDLKNWFDWTISSGLLNIKYWRG